MTSEQIIESFNNAWLALCRQYDDSCDETIRVALNKLSGIIRKVESDYNRSNDEGKQTVGQISIDEWLDWLNS